MAVNKNFVVKNGLEVNNNLILADADTNRVGIGTTVPLYTLDVRGGFAATDIYIAGVSTFVGEINANNGLDVTGHSELDSVNISGVATATSLDVNGLSELTDVLVSGGVTFLNGISGLTTFSGGIDVVGQTQLDDVNISGIVTISSANITGISTFGGLIDANSGIDVTGQSELDDVNISGVATVASLDVNGLSDLTDINVSGTSTFSGDATFAGGVKITAGIITSANPGVTTVVYYGDGRYLEGVIGGVGIATTGGLVGTGATILNFVGSGVSSIVFDSTVGIATINLSGGGAESSTTSKSTITYTATEGQTTFSATYVVGNGSVDVYLNGARLSSSEFTATDGTSVVLTYPAVEGDTIDIVVFDFGNSVRGIQGLTGVQGIQGIRGLDGAFAAQGVQGPQGTQGLTGIQGFDGLQGIQGLDGAYAAQGIQGTQGLQGIQGFSFLREVTSFTATASQTTFNLTYAIGTVDVYLNGVRLSETEYTATDGTSVVLVYPATLGDSVDIISFQSAGPQGVQGIQGVQGVQGVQGLDGAYAAQGIQGPQGLSGTYIVDDTTTNSELYIVFSDSSSGITTTFNVSSTKLTFNPSNGYITAVDFNSTSDQRLKEDIQSISNSIEILNKINPVGFSWKETKEKSYGVIAQELEQVLPELVREGEEYKSVSYIPLIALLIDSVKQHQKEIEDLKSKLNN